MQTAAPLGVAILRELAIQTVLSSEEDNFDEDAALAVSSVAAPVECLAHLFCGVASRTLSGAITPESHESSGVIAFTASP